MNIMQYSSEKKKIKVHILARGGAIVESAVTLRETHFEEVALEITMFYK